MILVTVGTHTQQFDRLVSAADELAVLIKEQVIIQCGCTKALPVHAKFERFYSPAEMQDLVKQARVVIAHAGAGTALNSLKLKKPLVIVPREKRFGESVDDHQTQLAVGLATQGKAILVESVSAEGLLTAVKKADDIEVSSTSQPQLIQSLRKTLRLMERQIN